MNTSIPSFANFSVYSISILSYCSNGIFIVIFSHGDKSIFSPISLLKIKYETLFDSPIFIIFINNIVNCIFIKFEFDSLHF